MTIDEQKIRSSVRDLIEVRTSNLGVEITMPVAYPGGDLVDVIVEQSASGYVVHDSSFGTMRLTASGVRLSTPTVAKLKSIAGRYKCSFIDGRVSALAKDQDLPVIIALVANASRAIADQLFEPRRHSDYIFRVEVTERLREFVGSKRVRENEEVKGYSGRSYRISAVVLDPLQSKTTNFLATITSRSSVPTHFAEFYDLKEEHGDVEADAVYDETSDIRGEDQALLRRVCDQLIAFSQTRTKFKGMFGGTPQIQ